MHTTVGATAEHIRLGNELQLAALTQTRFEPCTFGLLTPE